MSIYSKLTLIQSELKAPKNQYNAFGKYKYRNCEDILEALKPILLKYDCSLFITDSLEQKGDRYYINAQSTLIDNETEKQIIVEGWAREEESKKGMDGSQVTGASSSYARKYALNGMFAIDDTQDSDATNKNENVLTQDQIKRIYAIAKESSLGEDAIKKWIKSKYDKESLKTLSIKEYEELVNALKNAKEPK